MQCKLFFEQYNIITKKVNENTYIKDILRRKWILLTPEEWVRQNLIWYLHQTKNYSLQQMAIEKQIIIGEKIKRFDLVIYDEHIRPLFLIECKKQSEKITEKSLMQLLSYQTKLQAQFIVLSNGVETYCWDSIQQSFCTEIPSYKNKSHTSV